MNRILLFALLLLVQISDQLDGQELMGDIIYGEEGFDLLGDKVSISEDGNVLAFSVPTLTLNKPGYVRIMEWDGSAWKDKGVEISDGNLANRIRFPMALSKTGNRIAFAANFIEDFQYEGFGRVYDFENGSWQQLGQTIDDGRIVNSFEKRSLAMDDAGNRIAIGRPDLQEPIRQAGSVIVWELLGDRWIQMGQEITGEKEQDRLGNSVHLSSDGNRMAVSFDQGGNQPGGVRIMEYTGNEWVQMGADLKGKQGELNFGKKIKFAQGGSQIVICSDGDESGSGRIAVFELVNERWLQKGNTISGQYDDEHLGHTISISNDGNILLASSKGSIRIFLYRNRSWLELDAGFIQQSFDLPSSTAISGTGNRIVIGNADYSEVEMQIGSVQVYDYDIESLGGVLSQEIDIFPNPVQDELNILLRPTGESELMIRDTNGRLIKKASNVTSINVADLIPGFYFIEVSVNDESKIIKFIKS